MTDTSLIGWGNIQDEIEKNKIRGSSAIGMGEKRQITSNEFNALADVNPVNSPTNDTEGTRDQNFTNSEFLDFFNNLEELLKNSISQLNSILKGDLDENSRKNLETELASFELALKINDLDKKIETTTSSQEKDNLIKDKMVILDNKLDLDMQIAGKIAESTTTNEKEKKIAKVNIQTSALYKKNVEIAKEIAELKEKLSSATEEQKKEIQNEINKNKLLIEQNSIDASNIVLTDINDRLKNETMNENERQQLEKEKVFFEKVLQHNTLRKDFVNLTMQVDNTIGEEKEKFKAELDQKQRTIFQEDKNNYLKIIQERNNEITKQQTISRQKNLEKAQQKPVVRER
ncbi:MAG: hypothetical protein Ta2D_14160 [Rickettsiales bacterium]|nr:MAG: hypothetical protein Ta2D_14160 [Rickettsiales bacterium]